MLLLSLGSHILLWIWGTKEWLVAKGWAFRTAVCLLPRKLPHSGSLGSCRLMDPGATCWTQYHTAPKALHPRAGNTLCPCPSSPNISTIKVTSSYFLFFVPRFSRRPRKGVRRTMDHQEGWEQHPSPQKDEDRGAVWGLKEGPPPSLIS